MTDYSIFEVFRSNFFYILIGLSIFLFIQGAYSFYQGPIKARLDVSRRLRSTIIGNVQEKALEELLQSRGLNQSGELRYPVMRAFNEIVVRSGTTFGVVPIIIIMVLITLVTPFLIWALGYPLLIGIAIGIVAGPLLPLAVLNFMTRRRITKFGDQLPDAISMISRSLRVGHPLPVAVRMVGREMPDPVGSEFAIVSGELAAGLSLNQAVKNLEGRVGQEDIPMLVASIVIQSDTGGNLGEILNVLSNIMRNRVRLRRKVRALTSEGRISARALTALPFLLYLALRVTAPDYYTVAWTDEITKYVLGGAAIWMIIGNIVMMNMVNIKF